MNMSVLRMPENNILLVDDEEDIRDVLGIYLSEAGYRVITAENGEEAITKFMAQKPKVVLTDIKMPGIDGVQLLKRIKEEEPETEVILITGHGDMDLAIQSFKHDATDFITKPINHDILDIALNRAYERIDLRRKIRDYTENLENLVKDQAAKLVEAERLAAIGQAVEGITNVFGNLADDVEGGMGYFNEMPCLVSIHNQECKIVTSNQLYKQILGDRTGEDSASIYTDKSEEDCPVRQTFKMGMGRRSRETVVYKNGETIPVIVQTTPIRNRAGELELVLETITDIAEMKRLRDKLTATEKRYQQLFDEAPCYISVQNKEFNIVQTNRLFKEDFGIHAGSPCYQVYKHRDTPCDDCPVSKTFEDGRSHHAELVVTSRDGEKKNVLVRTAPLFNSMGDVEFVMEMSTNITEIRNLQNHLTNLGLLIGSVSHGIKGLLTGLDGGMYLLGSGMEKDDNVKITEGWEIVQFTVDRIRKMVLDILFYAKDRNLNWERIDAVSFSNGLVRTMKTKIEKHNISFIVDIDSETGDLEVDPGVVSSALINILENALDACLVDKAKKNHEISFTVSKADNDVLFEVQDNGIGMNRETMDSMFTLFFSSKGTRGTGLGLFISDRIIRQHNGSIIVESEPGKGAHFMIRIPAEAPAYAAVE